MKTRALGPFQPSAIGLGCMNFSHGYAPAVSQEQAARVFHRAFDLGVTLFDTAAIYGNGANERLLGPLVRSIRDQIVLCSKGGMASVQTPQGVQRKVDSRPETLRQNLDESLSRLQVDVIDLYYVHRWDKQTPIEDVAGTLGDLVREGKIRAVGLSEVSGATLRRAAAQYPIAAVQSEYSLWTRNPEIGLLPACRDLGTKLVAFSPLGRGFLTATPPTLAELHAGDMRHKMPRFAPGAFEQNRALVHALWEVAREAGCTPAQAAIAWGLQQGSEILTIPGTTSVAHLEDNLGADAVTLSDKHLAHLADVFSPDRISGGRYDAAMQSSVDTEDFPFPQRKTQE
ncbi:MAG: hypothetical protein RJA77_483 [Pseudomonadota bacterium]